MYVMSSNNTSMKTKSSLLKKRGRQERSSRIDCDQGLVFDRYATNAAGATSPRGWADLVVATTSQTLHAKEPWIKVN